MPASSASGPRQVPASLSNLSDTSEVSGISEAESFYSLPQTPASTSSPRSRLTQIPASASGPRSGKALNDRRASAPPEVSPSRSAPEPVEAFRSAQPFAPRSRRPSRAQVVEAQRSMGDLREEAPAPGLRAGGRRLPRARRARPMLGLALLALPLSLALGGCFLALVHVRLRACAASLERRHGALQPSLDSPWFAPFIGAAQSDGSRRVLMSSALLDPLQPCGERQVRSHEPFRRSLLEVGWHLQRLAEAATAEARAGGETTSELGAGPGARRVKTLNFFSWFACRFEPSLSAHHEREEREPFSAARQWQAAPDSVGADRGPIVEMLAELAALAPAEHESPLRVDAALVSASEAWESLRSFLFAHFTERELAVLQAEQPGCQRSELRAAAARLRRIELPMASEAMVQWAGEERYERWAAEELPLRIRLLHDYLWMPAHAVWHNGFLQSLRSEQPERLDETGGLFCAASEASARRA